MIGLTPRQSDLLAWLRARTEPWGPTFREMMAAVGCSLGNVQRLVGALEERGYVRRIPDRPRAIELTEDGGEKLVTVAGQRFRFIPKTRARA